MPELWTAKLPDDWNPQYGLRFPLTVMWKGYNRTFDDYISYHIFINKVFEEDIQSAKYNPVQYDRPYDS